MSVFRKIAASFTRPQTRGDQFPHVKRNEIDPSDKWLTTGELGDGAFGKVYKVQNKQYDLQNLNSNPKNNNPKNNNPQDKQIVRTAAAKIIPFSSSSSNQVAFNQELKEYYTEICILAKCDQNSIIRLVEALLYQDHLWVLIEFCDGGALDDVMHVLERSFNEAQVLAVFQQAVAGLDYLHTEAHVIHRDIKAENLLLNSEGMVKLADFGVSAMLKNPGETRNTFIGSPFWMAPEVIMCETMRDSPYNEKCDIWSLAITLIELAQQEPPHNELNPMRVLIRIQKASPPTLDRPSRWSKQFNNSLELMLKKNFKQRPSCDQILEDFSWIKTSSVENNRKVMREVFCESKAEVIEEQIEEEDMSSFTDDSGVLNGWSDYNGGKMNFENADLNGFEVILKEENNSMDPSLSDEVCVEVSRQVVGPQIENPQTGNKNTENPKISSQKTENPQISSHDQKIRVNQTPPISPKPAAPLTPLQIDTKHTTSLPEFTELETSTDPSPKSFLGVRRSNRSNVSSCSETGSVDLQISELPPGFEDDDKFDQKVRAVSPEVPSANPMPPLPTIKTANKISTKLTENTIVSNVNSIAPPRASTPISPQPSLPSPALSIKSSTSSTKKRRAPLPPTAANTKPSNQAQIQPNPAQNSKPTIQQQITDSQTKKITPDSSKITKIPRSKATKTLKKTRRFVVDGVEVQVTTTKTLRNGQISEEESVKRRNQRRNILRELRRLHMEEQKEMSQLTSKLAAQLDQMLSGFEQERHAISHKYESDLEAMSKQQKMRVEKLEWSQDQERKKSVVNLKNAQKLQREEWNVTLKQERKTLKRTLTRDVNRNEQVHRQNTLNGEQRLRTEQFLGKLTRDLNTHMVSATRVHREQMIKYEKQFLCDRQDLIGKKEEQLCSMEERQLHTKHQTVKEQMKEQYRLQRNQLIRRHEKENEHQHKSQLSDLEDLETKHRSEKKRFPAVQRSEAKTRLSMFKQKLKIDRVSDAVYKSKLKKFQVNEEQRMQNERLEQQLKHDRQRTEMLDSHKAEAEEMQSVQNEKRKMLIEREQERLFALDDAFKRDFEAWRNQLPNRKIMLEHKFQRQRKEQDDFFQKHMTDSAPRQVPPKQNSVGEKSGSTSFYSSSNQDSGVYRKESTVSNNSKRMTYDI